MTKTEAKSFQSDWEPFRFQRSLYPADSSVLVYNQDRSITIEMHKDMFQTSDYEELMQALFADKGAKVFHLCRLQDGTVEFDEEQMFLPDQGW